MCTQHGVRRVALAMARTLLTAGIMSIASAAAATAQAAGDPEVQALGDTSLVQEIELASNSKLIGRVVEIRNGRVTFRTLDGVELTFPLSQVSSIQVLEGQLRGREFWPRDRNDSRLFLGPTARVVGDGHGYAGVYELFFPSAAVGVGEVAMVSAGMSVFPTVALSDQFFFIAPKVRLLGTEFLSAAAGAFWFGIASSDESGGAAYAVLTAGSETAALTLGPAFPFFSEGGFTDDFLGMVGGELRVSRSLKLISENWIIPEGEGALLALGVRFVERRFGIELAGLTTSDFETVLPVLNFSYTW